MITVVLHWCYLFITAYCLGFLFSEFCGKFFGYRLKRIETYLVSGIVILTVYAQFFSLFHKVGLAANVILIVIVLMIIVLKRKQLFGAISSFGKENSRFYKLAIVILFLLWAYFTSRGYMAYDSDLYHGQSIRWMEEYGVIKGLGNLHNRFAYNSSVFALHALLSMKELLGGVSLHTASGFIAFVLTLSVMPLGKVWKRKKFLLSDYARMAAIYYLIIICDEVISPASDCVVMCMIFYIIITWVELLEQKDGQKDNIVPYCLLCVAGVYTLTLKLTAGLILILLIKPAVYLLKNKKWKDIGIYLLLGIVVAAPWMIRSVMISGWLIYPLPELDLFNVEWKMPKLTLISDAAEIKVWGRALYDVALANVPVTQWFGNWFRSNLLATEKILILADIVALAVAAISVVFTFVKRKWQNLDVLLVICTVACSYLYWQLSAPLTRYGYAYILLLVVLTFGWLLSCMKFKWVNGLVAIGALLVAAYKLIWLVQYIGGSLSAPYYVMPQDYAYYEANENELNGVVFYTPKNGDQIGYHHFPSAISVAETEMLGDKLEDGFANKYREAYKELYKEIYGEVD